MKAARTRFQANCQLLLTFELSHYMPRQYFFICDPVLRSGLRVACLPLIAMVCQFAIAQSSSTTPGVQLKIGLGGVVRLGHWVPVSLIVNDPSIARTATILEITCPDDEDVPVTWRTTISPGTGSDTSPEVSVIQGLFRLGRASGTLEVRLLNDANEPVFTHSVSLTDTSVLQVVDGTSRIVLLLGQSDAFRDRFPSSDSIDKFVIATVSDPAGIPSLHLGLQSASRIIVGGSSGLVPGTAQAEAISHWVRQGGHLLLISDPETNASNDQLFAALVPGTVQGKSMLRTSTRLEYFAKAREQLAIKPDSPLPVHQLVAATDAEVMVQEQELPLVVRRAAGFGMVTWTAFDLDSELFAGWQGTTESLDKLIVRPFSEDRPDVRDVMANATARHGFVDFAGQLRMALEDFRSVRLVNFTSVAAISIFAILLFGVGDWFLLPYVFPSRTWTWFTFPLMVFGICLATWSIQNWSRPREFRVNHLEIVDLDQKSGSYRGSAWNCLYVPASTAADVNTRIQASWMGDPEFLATGWQGQPGSGLGGMQTNTGIRIGGGSYSVDNESIDGKFRSVTRSIDLAPSSVRTFRSQFVGKIAPATAGRLAINRRLGRLEGVVVNTLPGRLVRARVYFGEFVYILQGNMEPGEAVQITEMIERTSRSVLNRKEIISDRERKDISITTPWQVTDTDLSRIANMIMFHSLAGGSSYSGLTNDYYDQLEMSSLAELNRAVLVGEFVEPLSTLDVNISPHLGNTAQDKLELTDKSMTIVRLVLPVAAD